MKDNSMANEVMAPLKDDSVSVNVEKPIVVSEVTTNLMKRMKDDLREISKRFVRIGVTLYNFKEDRLYKELGYKNFELFVKAEFSLSKATAYTFIKLAAKFCVPTAEGAPSLEIRKEFQKFSSSQLVEMLGLDEDTLAKAKPTDTIRELQKLKKSVQTSGQNDAEDNGNGKSKSLSNRSKTAEQDSRVPLNRLFVGTAYSFEEISIHKPIIDRYCKEFHEKDGKSYRVEINIIWDSLTDGLIADSKIADNVNAPVDSDDEDAE